jgi:hypothetical protein
MNQKYLKHAALMLPFTFINPSFAMGGKIFKLARFVGVGTLPAVGLYKVYKRDEEAQKICKTVNPITDESLQQWFKEQKEQINIPNAELILLVKNKPWCSFIDKKNSYVALPDADASILNNALINQPKAEKEVREYSKKLEDLRRKKAHRGDIESLLSPSVDELDESLIKLYESSNDLNNKSIDEYKSTIARDSMILKHELGHIVHKDLQDRYYVTTTIPFGIEALAFGMTKTLRKLCNMEQQPKTFLKTMLRSSAAIGAIYPKLFMYGTGIMLFAKHQETQADKFACENAKSRLELEEFANYFEGLENPEWASKSRDEVRLLEATRYPIHPAPIDRKEMVESYIEKWDREHAHEDEKRA